MRTMACDCAAIWLSTVLAPAGAGFCQAAHPEISSARICAAVRPFTHVATRPAAALAFAFGSMIVIEPTVCGELAAGTPTVV